MTCEFCGNNKMNVVTYNILSGKRKVDACTQCIREVDKVVESIMDKAAQEVSDYVDELMAARKRIEETKK